MGLLSGIVDAATAVFHWFTGGATPAPAQTSGGAPAPANTGSGFLNAIDNLLTSGSTATADAAGMFGSATAFMQALTDGRMWRSLGWMVAGLILVILGLVWWSKGILAPPVRPRQPGPY
jgi:hypothetical protein